jgi:hypothetical protein
LEHTLGAHLGKTGLDVCVGQRHGSPPRAGRQTTTIASP